MILQQQTKSDKPSKVLTDTLSMLRLKIDEQKQRFFKFKADNTIEQEYSEFFLQPISLAMRVILVLLLLQQVITRINDDGAYEEKKRIVFLVFCAAALIVVKFLRFGFLQKLNWIVNIFAVLILADCFETEENKSQLRVFFNGIAFLLCFWIQGQNLIMDGLCLLSCFILIHIFRGIDVETGLLTVITIPTTLFLKYSHYLKDRQTIIAIKLSEFWLEVSQNVSFVQIIAFSYTKSSSTFSFKGCKQSSSQFSLMNSDEDLNSFLDRLIISTIDVAPNYQTKEFQRNIGKPLKQILIKLLDDSKWSFYAKDNKKYLGTAILEDSEFKINIRGLNSEDELFFLTLGIKDPESLQKENEKILLSTNLLEISLQNYQQRFEKLQGYLNNESINAITSLKVMQRTLESMNAQTDMLKDLAQQIEQREQSSWKKNQSLKGNISQQSKPPQTATAIYMSDQDKVAQQVLSQKQSQINDNDNNVLSRGNDEETGNKILKGIDDDFVKEDQEKQSPFDRPMMKSHFAKEIKQRDGQYLGEEMDLEDSIQYFSLRQIIQDVSELYSDKVTVSCSIDQDLMIRGKYTKLRTFLIALFENCFHLQEVDQVHSQLQFSQQENDNYFILEFISNEKEFFYFQDRENPAYSNGKSLDQALARVFRYLNGINIPLVQSLEFQQFMRYSELISAKPVNFTQDDKNFQLTATFLISLDQQRSSSLTAADRSGGNHQDSKKIQAQLDDDMTPPENQILSQYIDEDIKNNESAQHALQLSRIKSGILNKSNFRQINKPSKIQGNMLSSKSIRMSYLMTPKNLEINTNNNIVSYSEQENLIQNLSFPVLSSPQTPENFKSQYRFQPISIQKKFSNPGNIPLISGKGGFKDQLAGIKEGVFKNVAFPFNNMTNVEEEQIQEMRKSVKK